MSDMNKVIFSGNLGKNPVSVDLPNSGSVGSRFTVGSSYKFTDKNGNLQSKTTWFNVFVTNYQAAACNQYLAKGRGVTVVGRLQADPNGNPRIWTTNEGEPRTSFDVLASEVYFHSAGNGNGGSEQADSSQHSSDKSEGIPF